MGLDSVGHYVPASTDAPARSAFDKLSRSLRDPFPVANTAARTALLSTLAAASPAVVPSTSSPIFFYQQDLPKAYRTIYTVDGSNFIALSGAFVWANAAARAAATTMVAGDVGYQVDTKITYFRSATAWVAGGNSVNLQTDTTNSTVAVITQIGKGKIVGAGTLSTSEAVTFPVAFAAVPVVVVSYLGYRATGAFNDVGLTVSGSHAVAAAQAPSTTGFTAGLENPTGGALSAASDWYYNWVAIGVPA